MKSSILNNWERMVHERYNDDEFLKLFISKALNYALDLKMFDIKDYNYFLEYLKNRTNFVKTSKYVICEYIESITDNKNEQFIKDSFKSYTKLGEEKRMKIEIQIRKQIRKIEASQEKQLVNIKKTIEDMEADLIETKKELALEKCKIAQLSTNNKQLLKTHNDLKTQYIELSTKFINQNDELTTLKDRLNRVT
jgi:hypothetical protein